MAREPSRAHCARPTSRSRAGPLLLETGRGAVGPSTSSIQSPKHAPFCAGPGVQSSCGVVMFKNDALAKCVFLPLSSYIDVPRALSTEVLGWTHRPDEMGVVPRAGHSVQVSALEKSEIVEIVDLVVQNAADWVVSGLLVDGAARYARPDLVEEFTACLRQSTETRGPIYVPRRGQVRLSGVMYVGQRASAKFYGCALGRVVEKRESTGLTGTWNGNKVTLPVNSEGWRGRRDTSVSLTHHVTEAPVLVQSLIIQDPHDWVVNDFRIDGRSQLLYPGDLPSEALQAPEQLNMHLDVALKKVEILVSYAGDQEFGSEFKGTIVGCCLNN
jgi:hypothetical protein